MATVQSVTRSILRGIGLRCPECGRGRLTPSALALLSTLDRCPSCGVSFEPGRGEFTGAMMLAWGFIGVVSLMGYFVLHVFLSVPAWLEIGWLLFFAGVFPVVAYRNMKGAWVGLMHAAAGLRPPPPTSGAPERAPALPGVDRET